MSIFLILLITGLVAGIIGSLVGVGGGFIIIPILMMLFPNESQEKITTISLAVVFINAVSSSFTYAKMRRIDYKAGMILASCSIPGAILGALTTAYVSGGLFKKILGTVFICVSASLLLSGSKKDKDTSLSQNWPTWYVKRKMESKDGKQYEYAFNPWVGGIVSLFAGFLSSLLGIGGGVFQVPALIYLLNIPVYIATATSTFILSIVSITGSTTHLFSGVLIPVLKYVLMIAIGIVPGAYLGARLSGKISAAWIIRIFAISVALIGVKMVIAGVR